MKEVGAYSDPSQERRARPNLDFLDHKAASGPIGSVNLFGPDATPNVHENSRSWTDDVDKAEEMHEGAAMSKGAMTTEGEEESPGEGLTMLQNPNNC